MKYILEQINLIKEKDPALHSFLEVLLYPSFIIQIYYRIAHFFYQHKMFFIARFISEIGKKKTGIEIHPGATIGHNLFIDHGNGIVIGETSILHDNITIFHNVTLGGTKNIKIKRHPTIKNNVLIGCNTTILGNIVINDNVKIGAGSIILKSIDKNKTVVGLYK